MPNAQMTFSSSFDIHLENITVNGEWIEGDVVIKIELFGQKFDERKHFKTLNNVGTDIPLPFGATLHVTLRLENPKRVCADVEVRWGPIHPKTTQCVNI